MPSARNRKVKKIHYYFIIIIIIKIEGTFSHTLICALARRPVLQFQVCWCCHAGQRSNGEPYNALDVGAAASQFDQGPERDMAEAPLPYSRSFQLGQPPQDELQGQDEAAHFGS